MTHRDNRSAYSANEWLAMQQNGRFIASPARKAVKPSWGAFWAKVAISAAGCALFAAIGVLMAWRF